jgi:hypothetical protein
MEERAPPPLATLQLIPSHQTFTGIPKLHLYPICLALLAMIPTFNPRMSRNRRQMKRRPPGRFSTFQLPEQKTRQERSSCQIQLVKVVQRRRRLYIPKPECSKTQLEDYVTNTHLLATYASAHTYSVYLGDSATLSFLQIVRMMVESVAGQSPFTTDPRRHKIMESQFSLPSNTRITQLLPDQRTAMILIESFFIGVSLFSHLSWHEPSTTNIRP